MEYYLYSTLESRLELFKKKLHDKLVLFLFSKKFYKSLYMFKQKLPKHVFLLLNRVKQLHHQVYIHLFIQKGITQGVPTYSFELRFLGYQVSYQALALVTTTTSLYPDKKNNNNKYILRNSHGLKYIIPANSIFLNTISMKGD